MTNVVIVDYDPSWPDQFEQLAAGLRRHLGDGVLGIDHVGSTSVPGLAAKDVIDLQVTVSSLADADRLAPAFQRAGYVPPRTSWTTGRPVTQASPGCGVAWAIPTEAPRRVNAHVRIARWPNQRSRCCSGTTCGHIRMRPPPMRGSSMRWPNDSVTTWPPIPNSRIPPVT